MSAEIKVAIACLIAYLLGSVSGGIITSRIGKGPDLHTVGSKSTGASNVQRTMGWKYGLITFFIDAVKGILSCLIAEWICGDLYRQACSVWWGITGPYFSDSAAEKALRPPAV